ncbi:allantoate amidohydrolase [Solicola gregarius]|uniref:Allantoate amidohydrolase n=1 Tax=Solicola gregarius TaxID=2908642 RepID=A0AA46TMD9_9ACTN|nr:allantoate amidohydrolase [Solicola gregarius]UYM07073.1 allantoate amidohydrolase [Solicola gregarius]
MSLEQMWSQLRGIGRDPQTGGYHRYAWNDADMELREWFAAQAADRGLDLAEDGNGNQFAWWGDPAAGNAVLLGSHLDSVPDGGAYDGPLGVVSSFAAVDELRAQGVEPARPIVVANFADEEGARFGIACAGSRLLTGTLAPDHARGLRDRDGQTLDEALRSRGRDPERLGADHELLGRMGTFVELHVEQGRSLVDSDDAVGVASAIWPHGRYRFDFAGEANHAGATRMEDRRDPMLTYAMTVLAANKQARLTGARATFGRVEVHPNGTNAIASKVTGWLDARAADGETLDGLVERVTAQATDRAHRDDTTVAMTPESTSAVVAFDRALRDRLARLLGDAPVLPTGAGHDAGVLSTYGIPTAMLFVRNPTGVSHSPAEHAEWDDCVAGVRALTSVVADLVRP